MEWTELNPPVRTDDDASPAYPGLQSFEPIYVGSLRARGLYRFHDCTAGCFDVSYRGVLLVLQLLVVRLQPFFRPQLWNGIWQLLARFRSSRFPHSNPRLPVVITGPFIIFLLHNHSVIYKIIIFFSGEAKDSAIFPFFILLHKRAKPAPLPCATP